MFPATAWSVVMAAAEGTTPEVLLALDRLARTYWRPLYLYARGRGYNHDEAADAVQGFFSHLLSRDFLRHVQPEAGRFRTFLLTCFTRWLTDQRSYNQAAKRGSGMMPLSLEELGSLREMIPSQDESAGDAFDRDWAREVLAVAFRQLAERWSQRSEILRALRWHLEGDAGASASYVEIGRRLGMSEGAVKKAAYDLRQDLGRLIRLEVRRTVAGEDDIQDEIRHLVHLLRH